MAIEPAAAAQQATYSIHNRPCWTRHKPASPELRQDISCASTMNSIFHFYGLASGLSVLYLRRASHGAVIVLPLSECTADSDQNATDQRRYGSTLLGMVRATGQAGRRGLTVTSGRHGEEESAADRLHSAQAARRAHRRKTHLRRQ